MPRILDSTSSIREPCKRNAKALCNKTKPYSSRLLAAVCRQTRSALLPGSSIHWNIVFDSAHSSSAWTSDHHNHCQLQNEDPCQYHDSHYSHDLGATPSFSLTSRSLLPLATLAGCRTYHQTSSSLTSPTCTAGVSSCQFLHGPV